MFNSIKASFLTISQKFTINANIIQKLVLMGLVLLLACPAEITAMAGFSSKLSGLWGRATATKESRTGTAVVLTAVGLAASYGLYRAFSEYYATQAQAAIVTEHADLVRSARDGDHTIFSALPDSDRLSIRSNDGNTLLSCAVQSGSLETIRAITGHNLNLRDANGKTALIYAVLNGNTSLVSALLEQGADANFVASDNFTPLMYLAQVAHKYDSADIMAQRLIISMAVADQADYVNQCAGIANAMHLALLAFNNISTSLLSNSHSSEIRSLNQRNIIAFIKILLAHNARLTAKQMEHSAVKIAQNELEIAQQARAAEQTAQARAVVSDLIDGLIDQVVAVGNVSTEGGSGGGGGVTESKGGLTAPPENTPAENLKLYFELINGTNFSLAAYTDNWREVERLLTHRLVDVNARDEDGQTGLMIAVKNVNPAMVNCLLRYRADVRAGFNYNLLHDDFGFIPIMFLSLADTTNEFYQEAAAIAIIKALNNYELALTKRDMLHGRSVQACYATLGQYDQQFYQLMRSHFGAPESVGVLISCYNAKFTMPLF